MAKNVKAASDKSWKRPSHSSFEAPAYGEVVPVGTIVKYQDGTTHVVTEKGLKRVKTR